MQKTFEYIRLKLNGLYPDREIFGFCLLIAEHLTGLSRTKIIVNKNTIFSCEQMRIVEKYVENLIDFVPIQYILGEAFFYGLNFSVNRSTLIPRPETEELVDWIIEENKCRDVQNILDIGTGSGCIAVVLKKHLPTAIVTAFDISDEALQTASVNAANHQLDVAFVQSDILQFPKYDTKWDIIVSNPPYIPDNEKTEMDANVTAHEPHTALFVPTDDPVLFYRHIAMFARNHLTKGGKLYFEIHRNYGRDCVNLLTEFGFTEIILRKDMSENDRMICAVMSEIKRYF